MATISNRPETVFRMMPLSTSDPDPALLKLLTAASRAALEYHNLTPIGEPKVAIREVDEWVREIWLADGHDPASLGDQVLLLAFACVPKGSLN